MRATTVIIWCLTLLAPAALLSQVQSAHFAVHPATVTVQTGRTVRFTAVEQGSPSDSFTPQLIEWKALGGTIDNMGNFTAGNKTGVYPIMAQAGSLSAQATVRVISPNNKVVDEVLPGWIFVRRWHLRPQINSTLEVKVKTVLNGQTITHARLFLVNNKGEEKLLETRKSHHRRREHWHHYFNHVGWQWIDIRAYDHLNRVVAQVRRPI